MTFKGEVAKLEANTGGVLVTVENLRRVRAAHSADYSPRAVFLLPESHAARYVVGRVVTLTLSAKRTTRRTG